MPDKPVTDDQELVAGQAAPVADDDSSGVIEEQPSPELSVPVAGEQDELTSEGDEGEPRPQETAEPPSSEDEPLETDKQSEQAKRERKNRTAKRINALLEQNRELRDQLRAALLAQAKQPEPVAGASAEPVAGGATQTDSPEYWAALYHRETDDQRKAEYARRYELARERQLEERIANRIRQEQAMRQQAELLADELAELNSVSPIFKAGSTEIDPEAPLVKAAVAKAAQRGQRITNVGELLFWGNRVARDIVMQGGIRAQVEAKKTANKLNHTLAKTGLENPNRGSSPKGVDDKEARLKKLRELASRGDVEAARELTRYQLRQVYG